MTVIKSLNSFDKGFFGSTLIGTRRPLPKNFKPSKLEFNSADDINKYLLEQMKKVTAKAKKSAVKSSATPKTAPLPKDSIFSMFF